MNGTLIIDFDSTFVSVESLDELAAIALGGRQDRAEILEELTGITNLGMEGKLGFGESLERRLKMFQPNRGHIEQVTALLQKRITPSVVRNQAFFRAHGAQIYIISGGFAEYIIPIVTPLGIAADHVLANHFEFDAQGTAKGYDRTSPLSRDNGKVEQVATMALPSPVYVIGDGYTDYVVKKTGHAEKFIALTENINRPNVTRLADEVWQNFDRLREL